MKKQKIAGIGSLLVVLSACLIIYLAPAQPKGVRHGRTNFNSLLARSNFYFGEGQWMADLRTLAAGVRYLCSSRFSRLTHFMDTAPVVPKILPRLNLTASAPDIEEVKTIRFVGQWLSRAERMNGRYQWSGVCGLSPRFAVADCSSFSPGACCVSRLDVNRRVTEGSPCPPQGWPRSAELTRPATGRSSAGIQATNLQGV